MTVRAPRSVELALDEMLALAPDGMASSHSPDDVLGARFRPVAAEFSRIEASVLSMLPEIDPRTAPHLLTDWERLLGPDPCLAAISLDPETRGKLAYARLTGTGTICAGYFERLADSIGETITIHEYARTMAGRMQAGQALCPSPHHMTFRVDLTATHVVTFKAGAGQAGQPLGSFTGSAMECVIRRGAPLFTTPYFYYST